MTDSLEFYDYPGVLHVHSTFSDGLGRPAAIMRAANSAGCAFVILSDHDAMHAKPLEGWYTNCLLIAGEEINVGSREGHYLAAGMPEGISPHQSAQETINAVRRQGGIGFMAHPFPRPNKGFIDVSSVKWQDWQVNGFSGIEIWNYSSDLKESFNWLNWPLAFFRPGFFISGPPPEALQKWDELLLTRKVTGIGSVDAHGFPTGYGSMFRGLRTHLILRKPLDPAQPFEEARHAVLTALAEGRCYIGYDALADTAGFRVTAENGRLAATVGETMAWREGTRLVVRAPETGLIRILRGGRMVGSEFTQAFVLALDRPGVYRAEVYRKGMRLGQEVYRPWIFSNPIYVK